MRTLATLRNGLADAVRDAALAAQTPRFDVADHAPETLADVVSHYRACGRLLVWAGASDACIFDAASNWRFRAWHDWAHVRTLLGFDVESEVALGKWQAAEARSDALATLVHLEVSGQAAHYGRTGNFIADQVGWTLAQLGGK
jgi:hypothetical protein